MKMTKFGFSGKLFSIALALASAFAFGHSAEAAPKKVLVVTVTKGFRHSSIPTAEKVLGELAKKSGAFEVDYVRTDEEMAEKMTLASLKKYDGVIFANTTGNLPLPDKQGFLDWVKSGKAFFQAAFCGQHGDWFLRAAIPNSLLKNPLPVAAEVTRLKFHRKRKKSQSLVTSAATSLTVS